LETKDEEYKQLDIDYSNYVSTLNLGGIPEVTEVTEVPADEAAKK
jgi:hypothetical protein